MMTIEERRRKLFEAWAEDQGYRLGRNDLNAYQSRSTRYVWDSYNAALDAVVIQMPTRFEYSSPDSAGAAIFDCASAIKSTGLGLKMKP